MQQKNRLKEPKKIKIALMTRKHDDDSKHLLENNWKITIHKR